MGVCDSKIGPDDNEIPVRIYRAVRAPGAAPVAASADGPAARPLIMFFHGGGFVFGGLRMGDWLCSSAALRTGTVVVSVDYRSRRRTGSRPRWRTATRR